MIRVLALLILIAILLAGCGAAESTQTPVIIVVTATPAPSATTVPTQSPEPSATTVPTQSPVASDLLKHKQQLLNCQYQLKQLDDQIARWQAQLDVDGPLAIDVLSPAGQAAYLRLPQEQAYLQQFEDQRSYQQQQCELEEQIWQQQHPDAIVTETGATPNKSEHESFSFPGSRDLRTKPFDLKGGQYIVTWMAPCKISGLLQAEYPSTDVVLRITGALDPIDITLDAGRYAFFMRGNCNWSVSITSR